MNWEAVLVIGGVTLILGVVLLIPGLFWARRQARKVDHRYLCERCGGTKRLFFVRAPARLVMSALLVSAVVAAAHYLPNDISRLLVVYLGIPIAVAPALSLLRIRCLACEPEWKDEISK